MFFHILNEILPTGYKFEWTIIISVVAIILALLTITNKSPIRSVLCLIFLFVTISLYLIVYKLYFIGISYILVYVGAVSILFIFILMLIDVRISELLTEGRNNVVLSILVVLAFTFAFNTKLSYSVSIYEQLHNINIFKQMFALLYNINIISFSEMEDNYVSLVSSYNWESSVVEISHISAIGNIIYSVIFMSIIIISLILLVAIIGSIITTVKPKDNINEINYNNVTNTDYINITSLQK